MKKTIIAALMLCFPVLPLMAADANSGDNLKKAFAEIGLNITAVADSRVPGLKQVLTDKGLFFSSNDGKFLIEGSVYDLEKRSLLNEEILRDVRKTGVAKFVGDSITYKAKDEKYSITVFTDTSCGYCRKLHSEMKKYNDAGITVRYLAFPRSGTSGETFNQLQSIWCAKDQRSAMDAAKAGSSVATASCSNTISEQYKLGQSFGVSGTPAIVLPNGTMIPGYQPVEALLPTLSANAS